MKIIKLNNKKINKGFTLIEILLVVGFIALAGLGVYIVYSKVSAGGQANTEARNLDTVRAGIKTLFGGTFNYSGVSNKILNDARITPDNMRPIPYVAGDSSIKNSFGGVVVVSANSLGPGISNAFDIQSTNIPGAVCAKLVTTAGVAFEQVNVNGIIVKAYGSNTLDIVKLASACASDTGDGVSISFDSI